MKIITYNVNGLRAAVTKGFPEWLAQERAGCALFAGNKAATGTVSGGGAGCFGGISITYILHRRRGIVESLF